MILKQSFNSIALLLAFENSDKAALALLLNSSFTWINSNGVRLENLTWAG